MIELLQQNPNLARGFNNGPNKINVKEEWNKIGAKINVLGPPTRSGEGWMKVWSDYKFKLRKKLAHNKRECFATGGGSYKQHVLSATEEAASNLLQLDSIFNARPAIGIKRSNNEMQRPKDNAEDFPVIEEPPIVENENPSTSNSAKEPTTQKETNKILFSQKPSKKSTTKTDLLEEQLRIQSALYTDVKKSLEEIERYQRKSFKLKEEKLKMFKENFKKKNEYRKELLKLRSEEIEIKRRRLVLQEKTV